MIFQKRQDFLPQRTGIALGETVRFELTREFHIESIDIRVTVVPSVDMATANPDGIQNILRRVQLQISDGARTRNVVDVEGPSLLELTRQWKGGLDRNTHAAIGTNPAAASTTILYYPVFFSHPQIEDPIGSSLLLPAPRFNSNPVLSLRFATQAEMDVNAAPEFALTSLAVQVIINRRQVTIANWPTYDTELAENQVAYTAVGNGQLYELQIPGSYTGILLRDYTSVSARGSIQVAGGENRLQILGTVLRRFQVENIQAENDRSLWNYPATWASFAGSYYLDFLTDKTGESCGELGSVLDANILQASGARVQLLQDITGGAGVLRKYVTHRIFGNLQPFKLSSIKKA